MKKTEVVGVIKTSSRQDQIDVWNRLPITENQRISLLNILRTEKRLSDSRQLDLKNCEETGFQKGLASRHDLPGYAVGRDDDAEDEKNEEKC